MDLGDRIERGVQLQECCVICDGAIMMGDTLKPFTCGHVAHTQCVRLEMGKRRERRNSARGRPGGSRLSETGIECRICHHRVGTFDSTTTLTVPQPEVQPPPQGPPEHNPHHGYNGRPLCGLCNRGSTTYDRLIHTFGMVACRSCEDNNRSKECPVCGVRLNSGFMPFNVDPKELENVVNHRN